MRSPLSSVIIAAAAMTALTGCHRSERNQEQRAGEGPRTAANKPPTTVTPGQIAKIEQLLVVTGIEADVERINAEGRESLARYADNEAHILDAVPESSQKDLVALRTRYIDAQRRLGESISWGRIKTPIIQFYAANFSVDEIDAIIAFYSSPAGNTLKQRSREQSGIINGAMKSLRDEIMPRSVAATEKLRSDVAALRGTANTGSSNDRALR